MSAKIKTVRNVPTLHVLFAESAINYWATDHAVKTSATSTTVLSAPHSPHAPLVQRAIPYSSTQYVSHHVVTTYLIA